MNPDPASEQASRDRNGLNPIGGNTAPTGRVLVWIYIGRIALAAALLARLPVDPIDRSDGTVYLAALMGVAILFSAISFGYTHSLHKRPSRVFLYAQVIFDALLLTAVVYLTGGERSMFSPLYILVISAGALLLPMVGGILIGLFASILFFVAAVGGDGSSAASIFLQAGLFAIVALITGYLGDRLRQTGAALGEVQTELRLLRLDTDDILETVGTGILTVDGRGRLVYLNPAAAELLSLSPSRWLDREILAELDAIAPGLGGVIDRTALGRRPISRFETQPLEDDTFILGVSTTPLERDGQERPPVTAIFQDITEKKRVEGLRRRAERLEAVAELSASLAHEIKNPLASIRSAVEQIASGKVSQEDQRFLGSLVVRESDRLSRLLGDFIDFARVKVVAPTPVDFVAVVSAVVDVVRSHPDASENRVVITYDRPDNSVYILGEEDLLHRAVFNLALNAVQWAGPDGLVELALDDIRSDLLSPALGAFQIARLSIKDSGPGVPEEMREQIFDPFFTRRKGGTGLGLALVQRAVEAHGGAIYVDNRSESEAGAVFCLYLPTLPANGELWLPEAKENEAVTQ